MPISQVFQELACTPAGLTEAEARQRVERFGPNCLPQVEGPGPLRRLLAQFDSVLVVGRGWLTIEAGSSMPLGAFLAGLLLSETSIGARSRRIFDLSAGSS